MPFQIEDMDENVLWGASGISMRFYSFNRTSKGGRQGADIISAKVINLLLY